MFRYYRNKEAKYYSCRKSLNAYSFFIGIPR